MTKLDYIVCSIVLVAVLASTAFMGHTVRERYEREAAYRQQQFDRACTRLEQKVDELEDFMTRKMEVIRVEHEAVVKDLIGTDE